MKYPQTYTTTEIKEWNCSSYDSTRPQKGYIPARPLCYMKWKGPSRFKQAWLVFIGKLDTLDWEN